MRRSAGSPARPVVLLIFDEVITGFRVALGGAQELLGVTPDLTVLGKAIGSGFPLSAVCGSRDVLSVVANGTVSHMGNFNGNPLAAAAGLATVRHLREHRSAVYPRLDASMRTVAGAFERARIEHGLPVRFNHTVGAGFGFSSAGPVRTHEDRLRSVPEDYGVFAARMLARGVLVPARGLWYVSTEHTDDDLARCTATIAAVAEELVSEMNGASQ